MTLAIGIDLGATKVAGALVNEEGATLSEARALTVAKAGVGPVVARITEVAAQLLAQASSLSSEPVIGVGIGTPGLVDGAVGIVRNAVNLGWLEVALAAEVGSALNAQTGESLPVWVENDANSQAVGELVFGAGRGLDSFAMIAIGTGLGGGIIANGQLVAGSNYSAAEMGHLSYDPDGGRLCACGLHGCVETVVSGPGLVKTVRELLLQNTYLSSPFQGDFHAEDVVNAARSGDPLALTAMAETARWLGMALATFSAVLNPAALIIGGGLGLSAFDLLVPAARIEVARRTIPQGPHGLQILPAQVLSSAVGAAALVWQNQSNQSMNIVR